MYFSSFIFLLFVSQIMAQPNVSMVHTSLRNNDLKALCETFDDQIEIDIPSTQGKYDQSNACKKLSEFLNATKIRNVESLHTGTARDKGAFYSIGKIQTSQIDYRLYIYYRKKKTLYFIKEIRIEA